MNTSTTRARSLSRLSVSPAPFDPRTPRWATLVPSIIGLICLLSGLSSTTQAAPPQPPAAELDRDPRIELASRIQGLKPQDLRATPVPGLYEMAQGSRISYITVDGHYALNGDLIELDKKDNLTETRRKELRAQAIRAVPESDMIVFAPSNPQYTVTVFTDVDCAYCREFHRQIAQYNQLGIRVRYVFYPRTGPNTESWTKAQQIWCSPNRSDALTQAKLGHALQTKPCSDNPVARTYSLGQDLDLQGTPAIVLADGALIGGYLSPPDLLQQLTKSPPPESPPR